MTWGVGPIDFKVNQFISRWIMGRGNSTSRPYDNATSLHPGMEVLFLMLSYKHRLRKLKCGWGNFPRSLHMWYCRVEILSTYGPKAMGSSSVFQRNDKEKVNDWGEPCNLIMELRACGPACLLSLSCLLFKMIVMKMPLLYKRKN